MRQALERSVIRILNVDGETVGTGFIVDDGLAVTCAHVVAQALSIKPESMDQARGKQINVAPCSDEDHRWLAMVEPDALSPVECDDVAFLKLSVPLNGSGPMPLARAESAVGHPFASLGFPKQSNTFKASWADGRIKGLIPAEGKHELLQVDGEEITYGMSGAPILDTETNTIVGMVSQGQNGRSAFATTSDTIAGLHPGLELEEVQQKSLPMVIRILIALGIYSLSVGLFYSVASVGMFIPKPILRKILQSEFPNISLLVFSAGVVAFFWLAIWLGVGLPESFKIPKKVERIVHQLHWGYPGGLLGVSLVVFFVITNQCQTPAVTFKLWGTGEIQPNTLISAAPNERLIFTVSPVEDTVIRCTWSSAGNGIASIGQHTSCASTVWLSAQPGNSAILTVAVNEGICSSRDNYTFPLLIRNPTK